LLLSVTIRIEGSSRFDNTMGLRDRDYTHRDFTGNGKRRMSKRSVTGMLILVNFVLWFANGLLFEGDSLTKLLSLRAGDIMHFPSYYRFLTYGFAHSPVNWTHIVFNMLGLLMFGYGMMLGIGPGGFGFVRGENVEHRLGKLEFVAFYLLTIVAGGIAFALTHSGVPQATCLGASGGVCGVVILYACLFPDKTLLLYGIFPIPIWALGVLIIVMDAMGAMGHGGDGRTAYHVHLAGAACGSLYYLFFFRQGIKLTDWFDSSSRPQRKPEIRIHTPEDSPMDSSLTDDEFSRRLDEILKRYGEVGESGLTSEEREFLQRASRRFSENHRKR